MTSDATPEKKETVYPDSRVPGLNVGVRTEDVDTDGVLHLAVPQGSVSQVLADGAFISEHSV